MPSDLLQTKDLNVSIKKVKILNDVNLTFERGKIYGLLGPNGAGKTTLLKVLLGIFHPSSGTVLLNNRDLYQKSSKEAIRSIGGIIEYPGFYENLTLFENLDLHLRYMGEGSSYYDIDELLMLVGLHDHKNKLFMQTSLGMKQRLGIARSMAHKPELLLLDEPTNGLDPLGIKQVREMLIGEVLRSGTTVIISSHLLSEINLMADELIIMNHGEIIFETKNMKRNHPIYLYKIFTPHTMGRHILEMISEQIILQHEDYVEIISTLSKNEFMQFVAENKIEIASFEVNELSLEDLYLRLISGSQTHEYSH
ncbi:ABC transporter ATP-binding protein [Paenibacillus donghaensis]|uniref:ABC transporter ATP-binding protein n=1 Tax=Paenibacillus donghaensis TaxID=414771 RepID=A0A2Z2KTJ6_9BACL|nr:ABC transporter ATP-binding protein [Paenibacillus donghaensis]ASA26549.1 ABC transporter ATP-binding protein [Paenibacillus donghaensis]